MNLKPGDVCVGQHFKNCTEFNGLECTVHEGPLLNLSCQMRGSTEVRTVPLCYRVIWSTGERTAIEPYYLRLKRPPSWDKWIYDTRDVETPNKEVAEA